MEPLISLRDIEHRQGEFALAIDRLDLHRGRLYALAGPNGSGKSTLLRLLALLEAPQRGQAWMAGEAVGARTRQRLRRQVTLVQQSPYLFAGSVKANLEFGLRLRRVGRLERRQRVAAALAAVGLDGFERRLTGELSGGEAQRVALARALALQPQLLLLDEPTAGLDRERLQELEQWLSRLPEGGMTVVLSTHDPGQPRRLGAEIILVRGGKLTGPLPLAADASLDLEE
ncbi:MAG: ATP-binding cassette domain-containing protein [Desulfuromonadales bacterium]|nr:ATP-binding cassette domain-containing protein [Desulfuromonadales bacterium]